MIFILFFQSINQEVGQSQNDENAHVKQKKYTSFKIHSDSDQSLGSTILSARATTSTSASSSNASASSKLDKFTSHQPRCPKDKLDLLSLDDLPTVPKLQR